MLRFSGFGDWIDIFRGGKQIDGAGSEHDGDTLIDRAVATFDAGLHEPPVVVGHPEADAPAWGWVEALRTVVRDGAKVLQAKFRQVAPEFSALVEQGRYKKRSAAFYPDGRLRHVGFLGAAPPAVKGLADVAFNDGGSPPICFEEETMPESITVEELEARLRDERKRMEAEKAAAVEDAKRQAAAEFAEKEAQIKLDATKRENAAWVREMTGKVPPAILEGVGEFLDGLTAGSGTLEFSDGATRTTVPPAEYFKRWLTRTFSNDVFAPLFAEMAVKEKVAGKKPGGKEDEDEAADMIGEAMARRGAKMKDAPQSGKGKGGK